jgi:hypothetical protein
MEPSKGSWAIVDVIPAEDLKKTIFHLTKGCPLRVKLDIDVDIDEIVRFGYPDIALPPRKLDPTPDL